MLVVPGLRTGDPGDLGGGAYRHSAWRTSPSCEVPDRHRVSGGCRGRGTWRRIATRLARPPAREPHRVQERATLPSLAPLRCAWLGPSVAARHGSGNGYRHWSVTRGTEAEAHGIDERRSRPVDVVPRYRSNGRAERHPPRSLAPAPLDKEAGAGGGS